jgi:GC-rich sequence DNA-binding factor
MLLKSGYTSFQQAVVETEALISRYLAHNNPRFDPDAIPARRRFLARRIKLLQNLLSWREYSGERFGVGELSVKLVEASIFPVARSGWEVGGEESLRKASVSLWFMLDVC